MKSNVMNKDKLFFQSLNYCREATGISFFYLSTHYGHCYEFTLEIGFKTLNYCRLLTSEPSK